MSSCCLWCKDKNNKANHNCKALFWTSSKVVVYDAKIRIIKQITTYGNKNTKIFCCCLWCKDKNNKANHNCYSLHTILKVCCCLWCKDKNNKANHNTKKVLLVISSVVVYDAKIRIIKQITTLSLLPSVLTCCCLWCKDKNNKANHNGLVFPCVVICVVVYDAKIRIIKQITTIFCNGYFYECCCLWCKDKNNKANHNVLDILPDFHALLFMMQR